MQRSIRLAPSLLSADFSRLDREIESVQEAGADLLHIDVMDGHFVPNITIGPFIVEAIKRAARIPLDVHLMISEPAKFVRQFLDAGADSLNFHIETAPHPQAIIEKIRKHGAKAGLVLSPETPAETLLDHLGSVDQVLVMTVNPGFGGQKLIPECVEKVRTIARAAPGLEIEVDGGINIDTVPEVVSAGANVLVAGSAIFGKEDRAAAIAAMRRAAATALARQSEHAKQQ